MVITPSTRYEVVGDIYVNFSNPHVPKVVRLAKRQGYMNIATSFIWRTLFMSVWFQRGFCYTGKVMQYPSGMLVCVGIPAMARGSRNSQKEGIWSILFEELSKFHLPFLSENKTRAAFNPACHIKHLPLSVIYTGHTAHTSKQWLWSYSLECLTGLCKWGTADHRHQYRAYISLAEPLYSTK